MKAFLPGEFDPYTIPKHLLNTVQPQPPQPDHIEEHAQWISGIGSGSWFSIDKKKDKFYIKQYTPDGNIICAGLYENISKSPIDLIAAKVTYPSNCAIVTLEHAEKNIVLRGVHLN